MIDREKYKPLISKENMHNWGCPTCDPGILEYKDENFNYEEDSDYHKYSSEPSYQVPNDINYRYTLLLRCTNPSCKESVVSVGMYLTERIQEYDAYEEIIDVENHWFSPKYFHPPLHIFQIPESTPTEIKKTIIESFSLYFTNSFAATNQIRLALEILMTELGVERTYQNTKGEDKYYSLEKRIKKLDEQYSNIKDKCLAMKWLGNAGTHGDNNMTLDDVLDGYDLLSFVLNTLYITQSNHIDDITTRLNENKGI